MPRVARTEARPPHPIVRQRACQDSFREHGGDNAQTEDIECGIRSMYGGGASSTEGDAWGACWGYGLLRWAREGLDGAPEEGYFCLWNEGRRVVKGRAEGRQRRLTGRGN